MRIVILLACMFATAASAQSLTRDELANGYNLCKEMIGRCIIPQKGGPAGFCATDSAKNCMEINRLYIQSGAAAAAKQKQDDATIKDILQKAKQ